MKSKMPHRPSVLFVEGLYCFTLTDLGVARSFVLVKEIIQATRIILEGHPTEIFHGLSVCPEKDPYIFCPQVYIPGCLPCFFFFFFFFLPQLQNCAEGLTV